MLVFTGALDLGAHHPRAHTNIQTLFGQNTLGVARNAVIGHGQKFVHGFKHNGFRAKSVPNATKLQTNHTCANDAKPLRGLLEFQRPGGIDDDVVSKRRWWNFDWHRARCQNDVLGLQHLLLAAVRCETYLTIRIETALSRQGGHAITLE